jgi:hypothetical protein
LVNSLHLCFNLSNRAETSEPEFFVCLKLLVFAAEFMYVSTKDALSLKWGFRSLCQTTATEPLPIKARQYGLV